MLNTFLKKITQLSNCQIAIIISILWCGTGLINLGFFALDDYVHGFAQVIPAQKYSDISHIISLSGYRSPVPNIVLWLQSRLALGLGLSNPAHQVHFLFFCAAAISLLNLWAAHRHFEKNSSVGRVTLLVFGFFFLSPFIFSRTLVEVYSSVFVSLSSLFLCRYFNKTRLVDALGAVVALALAAQFRFQSGVLVLPLMIFIIYRRNIRDIFACLCVGLLAAWLIGYVDFVLKGEYFASLKLYWNWHIVNFATAYGKAQPFYLFFLLFFGLSMPPFLISRYRGLDWKALYGPLLPCLAYWLVFILAHSMAAHKEDRFMIPVIPLFFVLCAPLVDYHWKHRPKSNWRFIYLALINFTLILPVSLSTVQYNIIGFVNYLNDHPEFKRIYDVDTTLELYPDAFIAHGPLPKIKLNPENFDEAISKMECSDILVIRRDFISRYPGLEDRLQKHMEFEPGWTEKIVIRTNPKHNLRRSAVHSYLKPSCP